MGHASLGWSLHGLNPLEKVVLGVEVWGRVWEHIAEMSNALTQGLNEERLGVRVWN